uniref:Candidate secreted effector n=1 Tax=Meloidogyne incognita TaxID=6306 RepID=A0A914LMM0_MELIC
MPWKWSINSTTSPTQQHQPTSTQQHQLNQLQLNSINSTNQLNSINSTNFNSTASTQPTSTQQHQLNQLLQLSNIFIQQQLQLNNSLFYIFICRKFCPKCHGR